MIPSSFELSMPAVPQETIFASSLKYAVPISDVAPTPKSTIGVPSLSSAGRSLFPRSKVNPLEEKPVFPQMTMSTENDSPGMTYAWFTSVTSVAAADTETFGIAVKIMLAESIAASVFFNFFNIKIPSHFFSKDAAYRIRSAAGSRAVNA